ncbi:glycoside hydrolase family 13 protein [Russula earlei]|uniref:Glycoside hydrolase family 13 protein n=1 Tax=Russula earlei TaxID=71964 RepID=A0ACC0UGY7_9AGAM|nr:glycoside hydrolase family 13 protein [Russula earlei]
MTLSLFTILAFAALAHCMPFEPASKVVIAQMFEWTWDSLAAECTKFLGPAGYGFVQVSPPQEHIQGDQWWTDYQPVSYFLTSKRGNRTQFENMVNTCHVSGVKVIADTLWNHMSGAASGFGVGGSIWTCQLDGLAEHEYVRWRLAEYSNDLISLGVDGLRLDASKRMSREKISGITSCQFMRYVCNIHPDDIANISSRLTIRPYITQEVIWGDNNAVTPDMYTKNGDVQEFRFTYTVKYAFLRDGIASLQDFDNRGWVAGWGANNFVANHDTERSGDSLNVYSPSNIYTLATVFSLAHPYGTPTILSSYSYGSCWESAKISRWFCQHRWPAIAGMVGFRNNVGNAPLTGWISPSSQQIAFARGDLGFVAINNQDNQWAGPFATGLPTGWYCNVIDGPGTAFWVGSDGRLTATIGQRQAIALHTGALGTANPTPDPAPQVSVLFSETATTTNGENIFVAGNVPQLGQWDPSNAIRLDPTSYPVWGATVYLPPNITFEYKFLRKEANGNFVWESDPNRQATTPLSGVFPIVTNWR